MFFKAQDGFYGSQVWKTDGTSAGTVLVKDTYPGGSVTSPDQFTEVNGTLFFRASSAVHGLELWKSDGTDAGTVVYDLYPGTNSSIPGFLTPLNTSLLFSATDIAKGAELWKVDTSPVASTFTWNGNINTAWENADNWDGNAVPGTTSNVVLPSGRQRYPVINMSTTVNSLHCASGAAISVATGVNLIILN